jgi:Rieske Fe-S protein
MATFIQGAESGPSRTEQDETEVIDAGQGRGRTISGPDAIDEMIEIHRGRLHVRANRADWIDVADVRTVVRGHPIWFATAEIVGYLTVASRAVVAVVGVCSRCGCLLKLDASTEGLSCPSAGAVYRPDGRVADPGGHYRPPPLPLLQARLAGRRLQVLVPCGLDAS